MNIFNRVRDRLSSNPDGDKPLEKIENIEDQTAEQRELAQFVRSKVEEIRGTSSRIAHEGIWMTNTAYLLGFDSVYYDTKSRQFQPLGQSRQFLAKNRIHVNKILPIVQNRLARLCKNPPRYDVRPNSNSQKDKDAARLALKIITNVWDKEKVNSKRIDLYMWLQQCGLSYIKVGWDDEAGKPIPNLETGKLEYEGDISVVPYSAFEVFPDPMAKTEEECRFLITAKVRKLDYFRSKFERGNLVKQEDAWLLSTQYQLRINSMNVSGPTSSGTQEQMKNAAIELAYFERPSRKYPEGRLIIAANGVLLKDGPLPVDEIPFAKFDDIVIGGKYYSESIVTHLRPMQDQYNRVIARRAKWENDLLAGKYIAARGHGLSSEALNDTTEVVEYDPVPNAAEPHAMQIPNIPSYAYREEESLEKMINDVAGINEVSKGQLPSSGIPAIGMQLLTEQDDTRIGIMIEKHEYSWSKVGRLILKYAEKYYKTSRLLKEVGKGQHYLVKEFLGEDIQGNNDVVVIRGSTLPGSKVLRRQEIINIYQQGLLGDPSQPEVREKVLGMLEFGDVGEAWKDHDADMKQINDDLERMKRGEYVEVHELDNHKLHVAEKNRFRKSPDFRDLEVYSQQLILENIEKHIQAATEIMAEMEGVPTDEELAQIGQLQENQVSDAAMATGVFEDLKAQGSLVEEGIDPTQPALAEIEQQIDEEII